MPSAYDAGWDALEAEAPKARRPSEPASRPASAPRRAPQGLRPHQQARVEQARTLGDRIGSAFQYADDTVRMLANGATLGYADKFAARVSAAFTDKSYAQALKAERGITAKARARTGFNTDTFGDISPAEIVGGIASPINKITGAASGIRGLVMAGGAEAFVGGMGYSNEQTWKGTVTDGIRMVPWGLAGGLAVGTVTKTAGAIKLRAATKKAEVPTAEAPSVSPKALREGDEAPPAPKSKAQEAAPEAKPKPVEPEDGALTTPHELKASPEQAVANAARRVAQMTDEQAEAWAARVDAAEASGDLLDDPHYRSILNVDLSDVGTDPGALVRAVNAAEEIHEQVLDSIASRKTATKAVDNDVAGALKGGLDDDGISEMVQRSEQGIRDNRVATVLMARAGVEAVRAHAVFKEAIKAGTEGAAEALKDTLSRALWVYQQGAIIRSNAGRSLQIGQEANPHLATTGDDLWDIGTVDLKGKLSEALDNLGSDELDKLLGRLQTGDDIGEIFDVLMRPERAKAISNFRRVMGTFEAFLKSNALTPVTAITNGLGALLHDSFRNGLGRRWAAARAIRNGDEMTALGLKLEHEAAKEVYFRAHLYGLRNMLDRVKFDFWDSVEGVAGVGFGSGKARLYAGASKKALAAKGTFSTTVREVSSQNPKSRIRVNDLDGFNARVDELASTGGLGKLVGIAMRTGAVAVNTVDSLGTAAGKLFTGAVDEWGKGFTAFKEAHAHAARSAMKEALEMDVDPDAIVEFVKNRARQKVDLPDEEMWNSIEESLLRGHEPNAEMRDYLARKAAVEREALAVTVQDGPQTDVGQRLERFLGIDKLGIVFPYVRTPIRLLERGLVDYTPLGYLAREGREIIARGGPEAAIYKAQMELGTTVSALGVALGASGLFKVTNGGWDNANNLEGAPPLRLQVGDYYVELGRLDPFVTTLALGAMWGQAGKEGFRDHRQYGDFQQAMQTGLATAALGFKDAVISKSYLKGLKDTIALFEDGSPKLEVLTKLAGGVAARLVPLGGTQKLVNDTVRDNASEAISINDKLYQSLIGMGLGLPDKVNALGDPIEGRDFGVAVGKTGDTLDDVGKKLVEMGFDVSDVKKTDPTIGRLSSKQLQRLRVLRGHEAVDKEGRTMREALMDLLVDDGFYEIGSKEAQQELINETIRDFNKPAKELLMAEDKDYEVAQEAYSLVDYLKKQGLSVTEAEDQATQEVNDYYGTEFSF